jgi:lipid-binding SYLF domain-containing protein
MKKMTVLFVLLSLCILPVSAVGVKKNNKEEKKAAISEMAEATLQELTAENAGAKELLAKAYGYAVFDNMKLSLGISGGGGTGVAVDKSSGASTYMKMGTAGLNIGLGAQKYQLVFLFQDSKTFSNFVEKGWQADAQANAVAGKEGVATGTTFKNGMAVYQITEAGLMLQADIAGTKYWKNKKLNK